MRGLGVALCFGVLIGMSCRFTFTDDVVYSCQGDRDCGGGGFVCLRGACCHPTGDEVCGDGIDNDCDGKVDGDEGRVVELCNGRDDDCDGLTDEGFDLQLSLTNCGTCGHACEATQTCAAGACVRRAETDCGNGVDDDQNGASDCADTSCNLASCGGDCSCKGGVKTEALCDDGVDGDADGARDCADPDCDSKFCGVGCACLGGGRRETNCADQLDNDLDGGTDCDDAACAGQICQSGTTKRCSGTTCACNGGAVTPEEGALCGDGLDNDCDNSTDCGEALCDAQSCSADGGSSCVCAAGKKAERACANSADDDGDSLIDCLDLDCDGRSCSAAGTLAPDGGPACLCAGAAKTEAHCADRADNDGDGLIDCADFTNCLLGTACTRNNGMPGNCQSNRACN